MENIICWGLASFGTQGRLGGIPGCPPKVAGGWNLSRKELKGRPMISSPCKNCPLKNQPKDECIKDCKLLQTIQDVQGLIGGGTGLSAIDYTEELRYSIPRSLLRASVQY